MGKAENRKREEWKNEETIFIRRISQQIRESKIKHG